MAEFVKAKIQTPPTVWLLYFGLCIAAFTEHVQADCTVPLNIDMRVLTMEWDGQCYIYADDMGFCEYIYNNCEILGGTPAKFVSLEQQRHFYSEIIKNIYNNKAEGFSYFWIGLKYDKNTGDWKWANGDPLTWANWKTRPNKNNCLAVGDFEGTWKEQDASYFADGYICHKRQPTTTSPSTTTMTTSVSNTLTNIITTTTTTTTEAVTATITTTGGSSPTYPVHVAMEQTASESTVFVANEVKLQRSHAATQNPWVTQRAAIYEVIGSRGEHPYFPEKPNAVVKTWSALACCSKCTHILGCRVINYNSNERLCHLFLSREVLRRVEQEPGWIAYFLN